MPSSFVACGVRIDAAEFDQALNMVLRSPHYPGGRSVHLCNAYSLSLARRDPGYATILNEGGVNLPDGKPLAMLARHLRLSSGVRVYGPDLMTATLDRGRGMGLRHYLYGSTPETIDALKRQLQLQYPGLTIVGARPDAELIGPAAQQQPLSEVERQTLVDDIREAKPNLVWVGLGTPKQDRFAVSMSSEIPATFVAVGAAFDFLSGRKPQAPKTLQRVGLEWAFRLGAEPRRLWRRYLIGNAEFVMGVASDWRNDRNFQKSVRNIP